MPFLNSRLRTAFLCLVIGVAGCGAGGPETKEVSGKVTFRGRPLPTGMVVLSSRSGELLEPAGIDREGEFRIQAPAGTYRAAVVAMPSLNQVAAGQNPEESAGPARSLIPERYGSPETSGLEIEVKPEGPNEVTLELR